MPGCARSEIVRPGEIGVYHAWSRCVQRAYLCGEDPLTGRNFDYRRGWLETLLEHLAGVFAVDVGNYSILANHCHLVARTRPDIVLGWSDEEVAWRWKLAWPEWKDGRWRRMPTDEEIQRLLADPRRLAGARRGLSSLSWFMARWKEPIARRANAEMDRRGHFWEQRFGARQLLDSNALLMCMHYVDLNQVKAGQAASLEASNYSAIQTRIEAWRRHEAKASYEKFHREGSGQHELTLADVERLLERSWLAPIRIGGPVLLAPEAPQPIAAAPEDASVGRPTEPILSEPKASESADPAPESDSDAQEVAEPKPASQEAASQEAAFSEPLDASASAGEPARRRMQPLAKIPDESSTRGPTASPQRRRRGRQAKDPPQRTIHRRLKSRQRRRASDHSFLGESLEEYFRVLRETLADVMARRSPGSLEGGGARAGPGPPADPLVSEAMSDSTVHFLESRGLNSDRYSDAVEHFDEQQHGAVGHPDKVRQVAERNGRRWMHGIRHCRDVFT